MVFVKHLKKVLLKEQARNKRNTVKLTINGIEKSLAD